MQAIASLWCIPVVAAFFCSAMSGMAQGQAFGIVGFNNFANLNDAKRIFVTDDTGTMIRAAGTDYRIALYWATAGTTDETAFTQIGDSTGFLTGSLAGGFFGGGRTIKTPTPGPVLAFQCRAWAVAYGDSYEAALARGTGIGKGPIVELKTKDPYNYFETTPHIGGDAGFRGFAITIPEPRLFALWLLPMAAWLILRRCN